MGIISVVKANHLFWLGRYIERTFTSIGYFNEWYDKDIDEGAEHYDLYCRTFGIPNCYTTKEEFTFNYMYDHGNENSIMYSMLRAYDNAIVMRDEIKTSTLSYVQLALNIMEECKANGDPLYSHEEVVDYIYAFWGCVDDNVSNIESRNIIKCGKWLERVDTAVRLNKDQAYVKETVERLYICAKRIELRYNKEALVGVKSLVRQESYRKEDVLRLLGSVFPI